MKAKRGVYFLANDKVLNLAIAFLNSFRVHNRGINLCLIPYDEEYKNIAALRDQYNFDIFERTDILDYLDNISISFHQKKLGAYRKLAAWEGDFDEFVYIDLDTIVLDSIDFVFEHLNTHPILTSHSNIPELIKWVWKDSIYGKNFLTLEQIEFSANTGFFASRKNLLSKDVVQSRINSALKLKEDMVLFCMEQPFLNYLIVTSGHSYGSLSEMLLRDDRLKIKLECWAGIRGGIINNGSFYIENAPQYFLVHWAGLWQSNNGSLQDIPYKELWSYYRNLNPGYFKQRDAWP